MGIRTTATNTGSTSFEFWICVCLSGGPSPLASKNQFLSNRAFQVTFWIGRPESSKLRSSLPRTVDYVAHPQPPLLPKDCDTRSWNQQFSFKAETGTFRSPGSLYYHHYSYNYYLYDYVLLLFLSVCLNILHFSAPRPEPRVGSGSRRIVIAGRELRRMARERRTLVGPGPASHKVRVRS